MIFQNGRWFSVLFLSVFLILHSCKTEVAEELSDSVPDTTDLHIERFSELFLDSSEIQFFLRGNPDFATDSAGVLEFYRMRNYQFAWFNKDGMKEHASHFLNMLLNRLDEAPDGYRFPVSQLQQLHDTVHSVYYPYQGADSLTTRLELTLTSSYMEFARQIYVGVGDEAWKSLEWFIPRKKIAVTGLLDTLLKNPPGYISEAEPNHYMYNDLRDYLNLYSDVLNSGEWMVPEQNFKKLVKGDSSAVIAQIKKCLFLLGDLTEDDTTLVFEEKTEEAVVNFQYRHGLEADGVIGKSFMEQLSVPLESRINSILINMERCRWLPERPEGEFILVNLPEFKLHVFDGKEHLWHCNVIVGTTKTNTIIFTGNLKYVVFSPYWNVTRNIVVNEILPAAKKNPAYLQKHNMEAFLPGPPLKIIDPTTIDWKKYNSRTFPYHIRQKPGKSNSLGQVKFLFPNSYSIYLHDTPTKNLFRESKRSFSHGCIRVEEPFRLAEFLLRNDTAWTPEKIRKAMDSGKEKFVVLKNEVPVFLLYLTSWVDEYGELNFRNDLYGHDEKLQKVLFRMPLPQIQTDSLMTQEVL
ncbi:MAG: murein L,D-transpeptidase [Bacteroidetes bacterium]|nr:MAG: murein L,D-transpeptidase [Bacteroidota bacterium]